MVPIYTRATALSALALILVACSDTTKPRDNVVIDSVSENQTVKQIDFDNLKSQSNSVGFSAEGLSSLRERVEAFVSDGDAAGVNTLLVKDGKIIQYVEAGYQNVDEEVPISEDTIFRIYSMTKPIIGVAMMMLYEDGKFGLNDPITEIIPEFSQLKVFTEPDEAGNRELVEMDRPPTIAELMSHTAGFSYGFLDTDPLAPMYREKQILGSPDLETLIERLSETALLHQPGERWNYSVATDIQGAIIERLTGMSLGEFLEQRLFTPLGMTDTGFRIPSDDFNRLADGFFVDPSSGELVKMGEEQINMMGVVYREGAPLMESGGFGLASTLPDYARFVHMLASGGNFNGRQILKPDTIERMRQIETPTDYALDTPGLMSDNKLPGTGFGLNFGVVFDAETSPTPYGQGTYFWGGLASTWFWIDPEHDLYFIGMVQAFPVAGPVADFRRETANEIYAALE